MNAGLSDLRVNGELVPAAAIAAEAQHHAAPRDKPEVAWRKAADALAIRLLLLEEARRRGIVVEPLEIGPACFETEEEALIRALLDTAIVVQTPTEEDIRREWEKDPSRFHTPPLWEASHILCACDSSDVASREKAKARAALLATLLCEGAQDFAALAARESDCPSKTSGGALGQLGPGDTVPEFEAALAGLEAGEITAMPVVTRYGYHIIRLDAVAETRVLPFEVVRDRIANAMEKAAWVSAARQFTRDLLASAEISGADV